MLNQNVQRSGLNREAYLRVLISGFVPREATIGLLGNEAGIILHRQ